MSKPTATILPRIAKTPVRLVCRGGWDDDTTAAFANEKFEQLFLQGYLGAHEFDIPSLGRKAKEIEQLRLRAAGQVTGLDQFSGLLQLSIESVPENGIDLGLFPALQSISFEWDKHIAAQLAQLARLAAFACDRFAYETLDELSSLVNLKKIGIGRGRLRNLKGIDRLPLLESVSIGDLRSFDSIDGLTGLEGLRRIYLEGLPKLQGILKLQDFGDLQIVYIVKTPLETDFTDVRKHVNLEQVWLNGVALNLDWHELLGIENLKKIAIVDPSADEIPVAKIALDVGRTVVDFRIVGPKKRRQIQLNLA